MTETTKELAARLRRLDRESLTRFLEWGMTEQEKAEALADDDAYLAARRAEFEVINHDAETKLADERIYERMRRQDRVR
jgi:hypothetical protein